MICSVCGRSICVCELLSPVSPEADLIAKDEARDTLRCIYCDRPCDCGCDAEIACHGCSRCRSIKLPPFFTRVPLSEAEKMPDYDPEPTSIAASPGAPAPRETPVCQKCGQRPGTLMWVGDGGVLSYVHGGGQMWCGICVVTVQLTYARERAADIPRLEAELALLTSAGEALGT